MIYDRNIEHIFGDAMCKRLEFTYLIFTNLYLRGGWKGWKMITI